MALGWQYNGLPTLCVRQIGEFIGRKGRRVCSSRRIGMGSRAKKNPLAEREEYTGNGDRCCRILAFAVNDSTLGQIVG
jgi:hypothetical protein